MFVDRETVCHAGDVVADGAFKPALRDKFLDGFRHGGGCLLVHGKNVSNDTFGFDRHADDTVVAIEFVEEEVFQLEAGLRRANDRSLSP